MLQSTKEPRLFRILHANGFNLSKNWALFNSVLSCGYFSVGSSCQGQHLTFDVFVLLVTYRNS